MYDLLIRNGKLVDGTGAPARAADVAVKNGRIVAVDAAGRLTGSATRVLEADGMLLTPGFVDIHTHFDAQATWDPYFTPSSWHGVTSVVMGNCGVGFAPAAPDKHAWLINLMEGVEDIPGAAMHEGIKWEWESFPQFLDALERAPHAIDFGTQVPHGPLRAYVMGERGAKNELATPEDIQAMAAIVHGGLKAGALGFSTSRTMLHKSADGEFVPGTFAGVEEMFGIGRAMADVGHGVFQIAAEHTQIAKEFNWFRALAAETGRTVSFSLSQTDMMPELWKSILGLLEGAAADGLDIVGQVAGRAIGVMMGWKATAHPFATYPSWQLVKDLSWPERLAALHDPDFKARMLAETPLDMGFFASFITRSFDKMYIAGEQSGAVAFDYEPTPDRTVAAIAKATGRRPQEIAYEALMQKDGEAMMYFPLFNYATRSLDHLHTLHAHPRTRMGLSDAGAHCGAICDGGMPTFMLTHWTRDRTRGPKLPLEHIVRRQTSETAQLFGMRDRGVIAPGYRADINLIDYDRLRFSEPKMAFDLPAGGRRLLQDAEGYLATFVAGTCIVEDGKATGAMPGKLVRGPQAAPSHD